VLQKVPESLLLKIDDAAKPVQLRAGHRIFDEGSPCTHYPLLVDGVIRATKASPDGHEILLYRLNPGESCIITVLALLGETPYPANGMAETDLTLFAVPRALFLELVLNSPPFRGFVFEALSRRVAHLMALIDDVAFRRVDQRLATRLLDGGGPITATHQMLADEMGTTREVVSRILESFQDIGMVRLGRRKIEVLDRQALKRAQRAGAT
jgi:CRP/FNR family transcriptional regulator